MAMKAESVASHPAGDWDTPFRAVPDSKTGEFSRANAQVADLNAKTSTETRRTGDGVASK